MSTETILESDETSSLLRQLCLLTGEPVAQSVNRALREQVRRTREERALRSLTDRSELLARAMRANAGPGIPVNHCWGEADQRRTG